MKRGFIFFIFFSFTLVLHAIPYDSGWREFKQPNGVTFTARAWGDEFAAGWKPRMATGLFRVQMAITITPY
jgi:hypothetical protein